jgi:hypothetical protein
VSMPWFDYNEINNYGQPDPDGGFPKPDLNFAPPTGTAITNLLSGVISGINTPGGGIPSWGQVVTIKLDNPVNSQATYEAYLHLALLAPGDYIGEHVNVGDVIGYSGIDAMGENYRIGYALQSGPSYGFGAGFSNPGSAALYPQSIIDAARNGTLGSFSGSGNATLSDTSSGLGSFLQGVLQGIFSGSTGSTQQAPSLPSLPSLPSVDWQGLGIQTLFIIGGAVLVLLGLWTVFSNG